MSAEFDPRVLDRAVARATAGAVEALSAAIESALRNPAVQAMLAETIAGYLTKGGGPKEAPPIPMLSRVEAALPAAPQCHGGRSDGLTAARETRFRALWPDTALSARQVMHALNLLPGPVYNSPASMYGLAQRLGLPTQRQALAPPPPPSETERMLAEALAAPEARGPLPAPVAPEPAPEPAPAPAPEAEPTWPVPEHEAAAADPTPLTRVNNDKLTAERADAFRRLWPDQRHTQYEVLAALNALPGPPYANASGLYYIAQRLGLPAGRKEAAAQLAAPPAEPAAAVAEDGTPAWHAAARRMYEVDVAAALTIARRLQVAVEDVRALAAAEGWRKPPPRVKAPPTMAAPLPPAPIILPEPTVTRSVLEHAAQQADAERAAALTAPGKIEVVQDWYFAELLRGRKSKAEAERIVTTLAAPALLAATNKARAKHGLTPFVVTVRQVRREADRHDARA